ncbi:prolipoprotein diacylglyceryl transferase [Candidatus Babeliales bacterium]|nr:prolipoprotein diacylglyceryl transferase [Candidatus Babeliales bacterium]
MTLNPQLLHLYGVFSIHIYGLLITIGIVMGLFFALKDRELSKLYNPTALIDITSLTIFFALLGARILWAAELWDSLPSFQYLFYFWEPGYSILGAIIGGLLFLSFYLKNNTLIFLDRAAIYIPLMQVFGRMGCFFTGCCYGIQTDVSWAVIYTHPNHLAPLYCSVHPTQLYSATLLLFLFLFLYFYKDFFKKKGQLISLFLLGSSIERFLVDFLRADRTLIVSNFSYMQCIALLLICVSIGIFIFSQKVNK